MNFFNLSRPESSPALKKVYAIMRLTTLALIAFSLNISATVYSQKTKLSLDVSNQSIKEILFLIENQSEFRFIYESGKINLDKKVSVREKDQSVETILNRLFAKEGIKYEITENNLILINPAEKNDGPGIPVVAQGKKVTITGVVMDANGEPVIGANVVEKGTTNGTITDVDGKYILDNVSGKSLLVSYIGYISQEVTVRDGSPVNVKLLEDTQKLEEVVVVGYGIQKKVNLTGSVSSVSAEEIQDTPASSLSNALVGKIAGVLLTQSGGKPGASSDMTVRAKGTWNDTEPLYVIDGIIRDKFAFDGLDASEVENLSVLKDGASAAIYGARAANGVVLVTTKKGKMGKPVISYTGSIGLSDATKIPETQNAYNQALFINHNRDVENVDPTDLSYYTDDELEYFRKNNYNWLDEAWKQPLVTRHSLNVSGGNERVRYFIGGNYYYETGSFDNLSFKKYNLRSNIEANITKDLVATLNLNMDIRNDHKPYWRYDNDNDTMNDLYKALLFRTGQVPPYVNGLPTGSFVEWHPLEILGDNTGYNRKKYSNYEANISLQYNVPFVKGLSLKLLFNKYNRHTFIKQFNRPYSLYEFKMTGGHNHIVTDVVDFVKVRNDGDYLEEKYDTKDSYQLNGYITYANKFGKHDVGALFVYEQTEGTVDWFNGRRNYFISSAVDQLFAGSSDSKNSTVDGKGEETGRISYIGRLNYGYDDKYLVEASFRYDGSVNFAPKNRWGFFPSASLAWRVSEEKFFKENVRFMNYLKLRTSIGLLGNDRIVLKDKNAVSGWQWMQRYNLVDGAYFGSLSSGVAADVIPNVDITWEKSLTYNFGLDATFLNNKLSLNVDAFYRHTYDILGDRAASVPATFGAKMPSENYAVIDARGFEVELGYNDKIGDDFKYYVKGNLGYAVNEVITKDEAENLRSYKSEIGYSTDRKMGYIATGILRTQADLDALPEGYTIFGQKPELGMLNYRDLRGANSDEPDGVIDDNDKDWIINHTTPPLNYGISLGGSWKGISLDIFLQGVAGNDIMIDMRGAQARPQETNFDFWTDHWTPENVNAAFPRASRNAAGEESTFWVRDGSFMRLKNVNLAYALPKSVLTKLGVAQLKFFLTGNNLCLLQNKMKYYDPENSSIRAYPLMRSYSFGVNLSF